MADRMLNIIVKAKDEATSQLKNIADKVGEGLGKVSNAAGVAAAAITGFSIKAVKDLADLGESMGNIANKTGTSIQGINAMRVTAEEMGLSIDTVSAGITKMNVHLANFYDDSKKGDAALKSLGLKFKDIKDLNPEDQFIALGNAVANIDDPAKRASEAMKLFGKSGVDLLPFFQEGSASMEEMIKHAKDLGVNLDFASIQAADKADAAFDQLSTTLKGVEQQVAIALAPAIADLVNKLQPVIQAVSDWISKNPELTTSLLEVATGILSLVFIVPKIVAGIQAISAAMSFLAANPIGAVILGVALLVAGIIYLWNTNEGFRNAIITIWNAIKTFLGIIWTGISDGLGTFINTIKGIWNGWLVFFDILKGVWNQITGFLSETWANLTASINEGMGAASAAWNGFWQGMYDTVDSLIAGMMKLIGQITGAISSAVDSVKGAMNFVGSIGNKIGGAVGSAAQSVGSAIAGKRAAGGPTQAGGTYLVGENGPELLTMGGNGYVTPNDALGGGDTYVFTGNTFLDQNSAVKIMDMVIGKLRYQRKLA